MIVLYLAGFLGIAHLVPPPAPGLDAVHVTAFYAGHRTGLRIGLWLATLGAGFLGPFFAVISAQLRRIEGPGAPLAQAQLALGALTVLEFIVPQMLWQTAAYRPDRPPVAVQALTDAGWLMYIGITGTFLLQLGAIGAAVLADRRAEPILPRWVGYTSIWVGLLILPGSLCVFVSDGPFAWNGVFAFWVPLAAFAGWFPAMTVALWRSLDRPGPAPRDTVVHSVARA